MLELSVDIIEAIQEMIKCLECYVDISDRVGSWWGLKTADQASDFEIV